MAGGNSYNRGAKGGEGEGVWIGLVLVGYFWSGLLPFLFFFCRLVKRGFRKPNADGAIFFVANSARRCVKKIYFCWLLVGAFSFQSFFSSVNRPLAGAGKGWEGGGEARKGCRTKEIASFFLFLLAVLLGYATPRPRSFREGCVSARCSLSLVVAPTTGCATSEKTQRRVLRNQRVWGRGRGCKSSVDGACCYLCCFACFFFRYLFGPKMNVRTRIKNIRRCHSGPNKVAEGVGWEWLYQHVRGGGWEGDLLSERFFVGGVGCLCLLIIMYKKGSMHLLSRDGVSEVREGRHRQKRGGNGFCWCCFVCFCMLFFFCLRRGIRLQRTQQRK